MTVEEKKNLVRRVFGEVINQGKMEVANEVIGSSYVNHDLPAPTPGPEGFKQVIGFFRAGFPDLSIELHDVLADGDIISTRGTAHGTHTGEFQGIPPTGK